MREINITLKCDLHFKINLNDDCSFICICIIIIIDY